MRLSRATLPGPKSVPPRTTVVTLPRYGRQCHTHARGQGYYLCTMRARDRGFGQHLQQPPLKLHTRLRAVSAAAEAFGATEYARLAKAAIDCANSLRSFNVDADVRVPTLVTAGNQSSGKSSLVEALAGLALPRSSGTCTRCPTEVRLSRTPPSDTPWRAEVLLKRVYDEQGQRLQGSTPEALLGSTTRPADVASLVTTAQKILLNPTRAAACRSLQDFAPQPVGGDEANSMDMQLAVSEAYTSVFGNDGDARNELEFTRNSVVLVVSGADTDLSIIDLPGIISYHERGAHYVQMVKDMVRETIEQDHVTIVMALSAADDMENQAINQLAREVDPQGLRRIGVITKPDRIADGDHRKWMDVVQNTPGGRTHLHLGYYVVCNPNQEDLDRGITFSEARQKEQDFFGSDRRWKDAPAVLRPKLGVLSLRTELSRLLVERIQEQLPAMYQAARDQLKAIEGELAKLPAELDADPSLLLYTLLYTLATRVHSEVVASETASKALYQKLDAIYTEFAGNIRSSLPAFRVGRQLMLTSTGEESKGSSQKGMQKGTVMSLEEVQTLLRIHKGRELPGFSPYSAVEALLARFKGVWGDHARDCLDQATQAVSGAVEGVLEDVFREYPRALNEARYAVASYLDERRTTTAEVLDKLMEMEDTDIYTLQDAAFRELQHSHLLGLRQMYCKDNASNLWEEVHMAAAGSPNKRELSSEDELRILRAITTPVDAELQVMATALAYFKLSHTRVVDSVPLHIRGYLLRAFTNPKSLPTHVMQQLKSIGADADASSLLAEDPYTAARRAELQQQQTRLRDATRVLSRAMAGSRGRMAARPPGQAAREGPLDVEVVAKAELLPPTNTAASNAPGELVSADTGPMVEGATRNARLPLRGIRA